ncbi:MAG TPA: hypothetical protein VLB27_06150, partial [candidate division Zixibacteria bacterium]|nr:hypothetical protein [candidate division Zixibacteria bacterium]
MLLCALVFLWAPARLVWSAPTAIRYPQLRMLPPEGSLITPLPDFPTPVVFSISERFRQAPSLWERRLVRPEVLNSSWSDRQLTLRTNYAKDAYYTPITVDGLAFFEWRAERERAFTMRSQRTAALREAESGGGGLKVNIPIRSRAVESLFGEGGAGLQVSGNRMISFAGVSNWRDGTGLNNSQSSRFPSLEMEQTYRFNIVGTIGSKIFVKVNQDSRVNVPLANRLELRFKGSEDDVIKTIEAGNTTLSLPGASMLRYSSQVRGLFGIKTEAQVGPFQFTGIAPQEKANTERTTIEAGARNVEEFFRDMDFVRWKIFDLGLPEHFESPDDEIIEYQLYKKATGNNTTNYLKAQMFLDPRPDPLNPGQVRDTSVNEGVGTGDAIELIEPDQYTLYSKQRTIILDRASVNASTVLGIWLKMRRPDNTVYEIGNVTSGGEGEAILYTLKLLKLDHPVSPNANSRDAIVENYEWKNVYRIPSSLGIDFESPDLEALDLQLYRGVYGDERNTSNLSVQDNSIPYIQIIGLDQVSSGAKVPDGESDLKSQIFDWSRRIFILPSRFPFSDTTTYSGSPPLSEQVPEIYNTVTSQSDRQAASKYYFKFTSKIRSNSIQLAGANIVEGSEVVTANGERLVRGNDYNVVGNSIQLISERATDPGANVLVDYEVAPLFTVEKKTLLGGSLQYERGRDFKAGLVALFKSDKATTRKPKVGQETTKMFAYDLNTSFTLRPNFLTPILDAVPLVRAKGPSNLTISGEMARSHPNPNVDGEAFIDDFEGSRQELSLSTQRSRWRQSSRPVQLDPRYHPRAHLFWYNPLDPAVSSDVVYNEERTTAGGIIRPLTMVYEPTDIKIDTLVQEIVAVDSFFTIDTITVDSQGVPITVIDTTLDSTSIVYSDVFVSFYDPGVDRTDREAFRLQGTRGIPFEDNWAGIVYDFPSTVPNQSEAELLEIRLRIRKSKPGGHIHFDFGEISEDVIPDGVMQREDPQLEEWVNDDEPGDIGLDLMTNDQEKAWYAAVASFLIDPNDPSRDDFPYGSNDRIITSVEPLNLRGQQQNLNNPDLNRLRKVNGTQSNRFDIPLNYRVDTEDQLYNGDNDLDIANNYFSFKVSLDTAATENNFFVPGSELPNPSDPNAAPFQTIRIPIQDVRSLDTAVGNATWTNIKYVRIWFDSLADTTMVEIADMALVSSNWDDTIKYIDADRELTSPSVFSVSVVSDATDSGYTVPSGVTGNVDQINDITEREQALRLSYENFIAGDTGVVSKTQPSTNYMTYGSLRMFVHGDESMGPNHRINYFFRIGSDSLNYYEFRTELQPGWAESNEVVLDFNELTALKDSVIQAELTDSTGRINSGDAHPRYRVVGLPTLRSVRYLASLVCNADPT